MENNKTKVYIYIDDEPNPIAEIFPPITFNLDTTKLVDGEHRLRIISKFENKEGIKTIPFTVRNGPHIHVDGLSENDTINGIVPLMLNSYETGTNQSFIIKGSENPRTIPVWVWVLILSILAWGAFYSITSMMTAPA
jgi:hypothetical protein